MFMNNLPARLRDQVVEKTHGEVLKSVRFFHDREPEFMTEVIS